MYDGLIVQIRQLQHWFKPNGSDQFDPYVTLGEAADAIEQLIEERDAYRKAMTDEHNRAAKLAWGKEHCWIPVTERLPKAERKSYWVCTDTGYQCECRWTNDRFGIRESDKWGWKIFDIPQYQKVVAWMPLPKPYEPPKEE